MLNLRCLFSLILAGFGCIQGAAQGQPGVKLLSDGQVRMCRNGVEVPNEKFVFQFEWLKAFSQGVVIRELVTIATAARGGQVTDVCVVVPEDVSKAFGAAVTRETLLDYREMCEGKEVYTLEGLSFACQKAVSIARNHASAPHVTCKLADKK